MGYVNGEAKLAGIITCSRNRNDFGAGGLRVLFRISSTSRGGMIEGTFSVKVGFSINVRRYNEEERLMYLDRALAFCRENLVYS